MTFTNHPVPQSPVPSRDWSKAKLVGITAVVAVSLTYAGTKFSSGEFLAALCAGTAQPIKAQAQAPKAKLQAAQVSDWSLTVAQTVAFTQGLAAVPAAARFPITIWPRPGGEVQLRYVQSLKNTFDGAGWEAIASSPSNYLGMANDGLSLAVSPSTSAASGFRIDDPVNGNARILRDLLDKAGIPYHIATDTRLQPGDVGLVVGGPIQ